MMKPAHPSFSAAEVPEWEAGGGNKEGGWQGGEKNWPL